MKPDDVTRIDALISLAQMEVHKKSPSTSTTHIVPSHNIALALTAALMDRRLTYDHLTEAFLNSPRVRGIMDRVVIEPHPDIPADTVSNLGFSGGIRLHLKDGRVLESRSVSFARGHWTRSLGADEMWGKFSSCSEGRLAPSAARKLFDQLQGLDRLSSVNELNKAG